jgi:hypothetical protein
MTQYRFTPPTRKSRGGNPIAGLVHFVTDPVGTVLNAALDSRGGKDDRRNLEAGMFPFVVDDEYDTLNFDLPPVPDNPRVVPYYRAREATANAALPLLTEVYKTGVLVPGLPKEYRAAARDVAAIGAAKLARGPTPVQPPEQITLPRSDTGQNFMGGFIPPGGMAGFSQMAPASQLALTRGGRGTRTRSKRRKTRKTKTRRTKTRRTKTKRGKAKRFVKGSAAAKRYMAKIRRKRK